MTGTVLLVSGHGDMGGGEVMLLSAADALADMGVVPVVVAPNIPDKLVRAANDQGRRVTAFPPVHLRVPGSRLLAIRRAVRAARRSHPGALVWCHGLRPALATAGMRQRVVHLHRGPERLHLLALGAATVGARAVLVPSEDTLSRLPGWLRKSTRVFGNWTADLSGRARAEGVSNTAQEPVGGASAGGAPVIGYLGRLAPEKGIGTLVAALRGMSAPAPHLAVAGEATFVSGAGARDVRGALKSLGDGATQHGWSPPEDFLSTVDVLVCPSEWAEPFGLVAAEAMSAGVPVVVSDAGALPSVVGPEHPYIARAGDPDSLARTIRCALDELGTEAGEHAVAAARRRWETLWSPAAGRARVRDLLRELGVMA